MWREYFLGNASRKRGPDATCCAEDCVALRHRQSRWQNPTAIGEAAQQRARLKKELAQ
jgi:hypothetical protein